MLINMRKLGGKWVLGIFSFLIIASFAFWGIGDVIRGIVSRAGRAVVVVGDVEIGEPQIRREFNLQMSRLQPMFGNQIDSAQARDLGVLDQALDAVLVRTLYDLEGKRLGLTVGDAMIRGEIRDSPTFRNVQGGFDANTFASFLAAQRLTEERYVAMLRDDIKRRQLAGSVAGAAKAPSFLVDVFYRYGQERRIGAYFVIDGDSISDIGEPTEAELSAYHQANAERFTAPAYRSLTFIRITPEDILEEVSVSDDEIEAEFDDRQFEFMRPEQRTLDRIAAPDEATARKIHDALSQGRDFVTTAVEMTGVEANEVAFGVVAYNELLGDIADVVFGLGEGEISQPIEGAFGWHIFRVAAIDEAVMPPISEVRDQLVRGISLRRAADALYDVANRLDDIFAGGATIESAAREIALPLGRVDAVDENGDGLDGAPVSGLPAGPEFLATAFTTPSGEISLVIEAEDGSEFVLRVDGLIEPSLRPLDAVRDAVREAWRDERRDQAASARAEAAAARVASAENFDRVASDLGLTPARSEPVRRDGDGAGPVLSNELVAALFALRAAGGAATGRTRDGKGYAVIRLAEIVDANPGTDADGVAGQRNALRAGIANDLLDQYRAHLEERFPVDVNRGALEALF